MMTKTFKGANMFMSRNLVPPEIFDSLHDALKLNGADIFLYCDPSRNSPDDYHIISSRDHEKFEDLRKKGCNLLGPQCVLSCGIGCFLNKGSLVALHWMGSKYWHLVLTWKKRMRLESW